jgi:hypothetical protein
MPTADDAEAFNDLDSRLSAIDNLLRQVLIKNHDVIKLVAELKRQAHEAPDDVSQNAYVQTIVGVASEPVEQAVAKKMAPEHTASEHTAENKLSSPDFPFSPDDNHPEPRSVVPGFIQQSTVQPTPTGQAKPVNNANNWEFELGVKWFSRLGIVACLVGISLLLIQVFPMIPAPLKLIFGALLSVVMFVFSDRLRSVNPLLEHVLKGGGLSVGYLCLFAMFFIPPLQLINNFWLGVTCLFAYSWGLMLVAYRLKVQSVATLALGFGYYTGCFAGHAEIAYMSSLALNATAIIITRRLSQLTIAWPILMAVALLGWAFYGVFWPYDGAKLAIPVLTTPAYKGFLLVGLLLFGGHALYPPSKQTPKMGIYLVALSVFYLNFLGIPEQDNGMLELSLCLGQLILLKKLKLSPDNRSIMWVLALGFGVLATMRATGEHRLLNTDLLCVVLASQALGMAYVANKKTMPTAWLKGVLGVASNVLWVIAMASSVIGHNDPIVYASLKYTWITVCGFVVNHLINRPINRELGNVLAFFPHLYWLSSLYLFLPGDWLTVAFVLTGTIWLSLGFWRQSLAWRIQGMLWLLLALGKIVLIDLSVLEPLYKTIALLLLGLVLLTASYLYAKRGKQS